MVIAPTPKGCPVSGITKWINPERALVMLSFRHKSNDHFWFTLFHELAHLLLHGKKLLFLEGWDDGLNPEQEAEADAWASSTLIPPGKVKALGSLGDNRSEIIDFAQSIGIAPGIRITSYNVCYTKLLRNPTGSSSTRRR